MRAQLGSTGTSVADESTISVPVALHRRSTFMYKTRVRRSMFAVPVGAVACVNRGAGQEQLETQHIRRSRGGGSCLLLALTHPKIRFLSMF